MSTGGLKSKQVFNYIFEKAQQEGISLSPMKAIKLVYFCHAWYLGTMRKPLIDERVQAWEFGAVVPSLYRALKVYGAQDITYPILHNQDKYVLDLYLKKYNDIPKREIIKPNLSDEEKGIINIVWDNYKDLTAGQLSGIMHQPGTPWTKCYESTKRNIVIPDEMIRKYYEEKFKAAQ